MDTLSIADRSIRMGLIKGKDTKPEMIVRQLVHSMGHRYRLHRRDLPGCPDIVFGPTRKIIFVHGCYWHRHDEKHCKLTRLPKTRVDFWKPKLEANRARDMQQQTQLREAGWQILIVWECELAHKEQLENTLTAFLGGEGMQAIELFAGAGGLGIGVNRAGFKTAQVIEWNRYCCDTIRENKARRLSPIKDWPLFEGDVRDFDFRMFEDRLELVTGGPPCQPFSVGGKHRAHNDVRDMFPEAVRAVRHVRPRAFIFENVKGLTRSTFSNYYEYIFLQLSYPELERRVGEEWDDHLSRLERHHTSKRRARGLEYRVVRRVLNAANYGVAQKRERVFFVGFRADLGIEWSFPDETHSLDALIWQQCATTEYWEQHKVAKRKRVIPHTFKQRAKRLFDEPAKQAWRTVRDAIADLPDPQNQPMLSRMFQNHVFQPGARTYYGHTGSPIDEPAKTLKAGVHGVPGGENMVVLPYGTTRYFTVRESARLQTFPDDFVFHGSWGETMRQLGNAVPVGLATVVASSVKRQLLSVAAA